jgi:hypothetical protein
MIKTMHRVAIYLRITFEQTTANRSGSFARLPPEWAAR